MLLRKIYSVSVAILCLLVSPAAFAFLDVNLPFYGFLEDERLSESFPNPEEDFFVSGSSFDESDNENSFLRIPEQVSYIVLEGVNARVNSSDTFNNESNRIKKLGQQVFEISSEKSKVSIAPTDDVVSTSKSIDSFTLPPSLEALVNSSFGIVGGVIETVLGMFFGLVKHSESSRSDMNKFGVDPAPIKILKKRDLPGADDITVQSTENNKEVSKQNEAIDLQNLSTFRPEAIVAHSGLTLLETNKSDSNVETVKESSNVNETGNLNVSYHEAILQENIVGIITVSSTEAGLENLHTTKLPDTTVDWNPFPDDEHDEEDDDDDDPVVGPIPTHKLETRGTETDAAAKVTTLNLTDGRVDKDIVMKERAFIHLPREREHSESEEDSSFSGMGNLGIYALVIGSAYVAVVVALAGVAVAYKYRARLPRALRRQAPAGQNLENQQPSVVVT